MPRQRNASRRWLTLLGIVAATSSVVVGAVPPAHGASRPVRRQSAQESTHPSARHDRFVARYVAGHRSRRDRTGHLWHADATLAPHGQLTRLRHARSGPHGLRVGYERRQAPRYTVRVPRDDGRYIARFRLLKCRRGGCRQTTLVRHARAGDHRIHLTAPVRGSREGVTALVVRPSVALGPDQVELPTGGVFGSGSIWRIRTSGGQLAAHSHAMVKALSKSVADHWGGVAAFNAYSYGTNWYTVSAAQPRVTVHYSNCEHTSSTPPGLYGHQGQFVGVPIPADAAPTSGTDHELSIYQPSSDTLWDFWEAGHDSSGWHACWGGRMSHVSSSPGYFSGGFGMTATGIAAEGGAVSIHDVESGRIDHAVALAVMNPASRDDYRWPAQRSDGYDNSARAIPEGSRLRLDPSLDISKLHLSPVAAMIARAAQKYGFIVTDRSGAVSVGAESPAATEIAGGSDPWPQLLGGEPTYQVMHNFPWKKLEVLRGGYGRARVTRSTRS